MFYTGIADSGSSSIGLARSKTGVSAWERSQNNPIIDLGVNEGFHELYKSWPVFEHRWELWYSMGAERSSTMRIRFATLESHNLF